MERCTGSPQFRHRSLQKSRVGFARHCSREHCRPARASSPTPLEHFARQKAHRSPEFSLTSPLNAKLLSDRPDFVWEPGRDVTAYEVVVTSETLEPLARSNRIQVTHWQPESALPRGGFALASARVARRNHGERSGAARSCRALRDRRGQEVAGRIAQ